MSKSTAIVSSAISPSIGNLHGTYPGLIDPVSRLQQTIETVDALVTLGVSDIIIADNSGPNWNFEWARQLEPAKVHAIQMQQFRNKGITEIYTLLDALPLLPEDTPIIKLSGRYSLRQRLDERLDHQDFVFRRYSRSNKSDGRRAGMSYGHVSTVAYAVRNKAILGELLVQCLREVFGYSARVVGGRSLFRLMKNSFAPLNDRYDYHDPGVSIELGMLRALQALRLSGVYIDKLDVSGISGQDGKVFIE